jgi:hypothetical protein
MAVRRTCSPALARPSQRTCRKPYEHFHVPNTFSIQQRTAQTSAFQASSRARASGPPQVWV